MANSTKYSENMDLHEDHKVCGQSEIQIHVYRNNNSFPVEERTQVML